MFEQTAKKNIFKLVRRHDFKAISAAHWTCEELDQFDDNGQTALMIAAIQGDYRVIEALRNQGANTDLTDPNGRKAVDLAALHGQGLALIYLIDGGCGG